MFYVSYLSFKKKKIWCPKIYAYMWESLASQYWFTHMGYCQPLIIGLILWDPLCPKVQSHSGVLSLFPNELIVLEVKFFLFLIIFDFLANYLGDIALPALRWRSLSSSSEEIIDYRVLNRCGCDLGFYGQPKKVFDFSVKWNWQINSYWRWMIWDR